MQDFARAAMLSWEFATANFPASTAVAVTMTARVTKVQPGTTSGPGTANPLTKVKAGPTQDPRPLKSPRPLETLYQGHTQLQCLLLTTFPSPSRAQLPTLVLPTSRLWAHWCYHPPWSPWDLLWPFNMFDWPQYTISSVNMQKCNAVTHTLLNFASHAHLVLIQEP